MRIPTISQNRDPRRHGSPLAGSELIEPLADVVRHRAITALLPPEAARESVLSSARIRSHICARSQPLQK